MPDLVEKQVRDAVVTALTGLATTGANVFVHRFYPVADDTLPALLVYTDEEEIEHVTMTRGTRRKSHQLNVRVEVVAKHSTTVEDTLALIYKEVITALEADPTLGGLVKDLRNTGNTKDAEDRAVQSAMAGIMTWQADYDTQEGTPDVSVP